MQHNAKFKAANTEGDRPFCLLCKFVLKLPHVKLLHGLRQGCIPIILASAMHLQVLPDVSTWDYRGQDEIRNQHCNLWELQQRCVYLIF